MSEILIKNATVFTVNKNKDILKNTDVLIFNGKIKQIGQNLSSKNAKIINADKKVLLPGFVQTHVHLCQTLFRGMAENRELLYWLRDKIWPLEASHTPESMYYSSLLGIGEMLSSGTTTILDMGGVTHTDKIFEAIKTSGIRAFAGKAMMDTGIGVPDKILETTSESINSSMKLYEKWNNAENERIKYAFAPRFILSCSDNLFKEIKQLSDTYKIPVHTHAYENKNEGKEVVELKGLREFQYFEKTGLLNERFLAAHCVWTDDNDIKLMKENNIKVLHCPSSNFKLGSGMLNINKYLKEGINVSIGADGAPCNNNLDMLQEMKTSALMQNVLNHPGCIDAYKFIELSTIEGAKALGLENEIGSIETGKKADLILINLEDDFSTFSAETVDISTKIVYSATKSNIETVIVDGQILINNKLFLNLNKQEILDKCKKALI